MLKRTRSFASCEDLTSTRNRSKIWRDPPVGKSNFHQNPTGMPLRRTNQQDYDDVETLSDVDFVGNRPTSYQNISFQGNNWRESIQPLHPRKSIPIENRFQERIDLRDKLRIGDTQRRTKPAFPSSRAEVSDFYDGSANGRPRRKHPPITFNDSADDKRVEISKKSGSFSRESRAVDSDVEEIEEYLVEESAQFTPSGSVSRTNLVIDSDYEESAQFTSSGPVSRVSLAEDSDYEESEHIRPRPPRLSRKHPPITFDNAGHDRQKRVPFDYQTDDEGLYGGDAEDNDEVWDVADRNLDGRVELPFKEQIQFDEEITDIEEPEVLQNVIPSRQSQNNRIPEEFEFLEQESTNYLRDEGEVIDLEAAIIPTLQTPNFEELRTPDELEFSEPGTSDEATVTTESEYIFKGCTNPHNYKRLEMEIVVDRNRKIRFPDSYISEVLHSSGTVPLSMRRRPASSTQLEVTQPEQVVDVHPSQFPQLAPSFVQTVALPLTHQFEPVTDRRLLPTQPNLQNARLISKPTSGGLTQQRVFLESGSLAVTAHNQQLLAGPTRTYLPDNNIASTPPLNLVSRPPLASTEPKISETTIPKINEIPRPSTSSNNADHQSGVISTTQNSLDEEPQDHADQKIGKIFKFKKFYSANPMPHSSEQTNLSSVIEPKTKIPEKRDATNSSENTFEVRKVETLNPLQRLAQVLKVSEEYTSSQDSSSSDEVYQTRLGKGTVVADRRRGNEKKRKVSPKSEKKIKFTKIASRKAKGGGKPKSKLRTETKMSRVEVAGKKKSTEERRRKSKKKSNVADHPSENLLKLSPEKKHSGQSVKKTRQKHSKRAGKVTEVAGSNPRERRQSDDKFNLDSLGQTLKKETSSDDDVPLIARLEQSGKSLDLGKILQVTVNRIDGHPNFRKGKNAQDVNQFVCVSSPVKSEVTDAVCDASTIEKRRTDKSPGKKRRKSSSTKSTKEGKVDETSKKGDRKKTSSSRSPTKPSTSSKRPRKKGASSESNVSAKDVDSNSGNSSQTVGSSSKDENQSDHFVPFKKRKFQISQDSSQDMVAGEEAVHLPVPVEPENAIQSPSVAEAKNAPANVVSIKDFDKRAKNLEDLCQKLTKSVTSEKSPSVRKQKERKASKEKSKNLDDLPPESTESVTSEKSPSIPKQKERKVSKEKTKNLDYLPQESTEKDASIQKKLKKKESFKNSTKTKAKPSKKEKSPEKQPKVKKLKSKEKTTADDRKQKARLTEFNQRRISKDSDIVSNILAKPFNSRFVIGKKARNETDRDLTRVSAVVPVSVDAPQTFQRARKIVEKKGVKTTSEEVVQTEESRSLQTNQDSSAEDSDAALNDPTVDLYEFEEDEEEESEDDEVRFIAKVAAHSVKKTPQNDVTLSSKTVAPDSSKESPSKALASPSAKNRKVGGEATGSRVTRRTNRLRSQSVSSSDDELKIDLDYRSGESE